MSLIDTHCHLGHLGGSAEEVVAAAKAAGVDALIDIGIGLDDSAGAVGRAQRLPGAVFAAVGMHPNELEDFRTDPDGSLARLRTLAGCDGVVAVGETGLDFYRDRESPAVQEAAFAAHIALAKELRKALVIHTRAAEARVLAVLDAEGPPERVVMHCFSGDAGHARACAERGFYCSFAGNITYRNSDHLREAARTAPPELLLVETDAPYLAPHPHRGRDNGPAFLPLTAAALAAAVGRPAEELAAGLTANARRAFALG